VRIECDPVEALLVLGDRVEQVGHAATRGVLVDAVRDRVAGGLEHVRGAVLVGEALPEVDRAGPGGEPRHLCEDRGADGTVFCEEPGTPGCTAPGARNLVHPENVLALCTWIA
jgi:hypothetical protein